MLKSTVLSKISIPLAKLPLEPDKMLNDAAWIADDEYSSLINRKILSRLSIASVCRDCFNKPASIPQLPSVTSSNPKSSIPAQASVITPSSWITIFSIPLRPIISKIASIPCSWGIRIKVRKICRRCLPHDFDKLLAKTKIDVGEAISPKMSHALIRTLSGLRSL